MKNEVEVKFDLEFHQFLGKNCVDFSVSFGM